MYVVYLLRTLKVLVYSLSINIEDTLNNKHFEPVLVCCGFLAADSSSSSSNVVVCPFVLCLFIKLKNAC